MKGTTHAMLACSLTTGLSGVEVREVNRSLRAEDEKVLAADVKALLVSMACLYALRCMLPANSVKRRGEYRRQNLSCQSE